MKRLIFVLLGMELFCVACARRCPSYPTDRETYFPKNHGGETLTYYEQGGNDTVRFLCTMPSLSDAHKYPYCAKCACEIEARQTLRTDSTHINYYHRYVTISSAIPNSSDLCVTGSIFGINIHLDCIFNKYYGNMQLDTTWTSKTGHTYQNVYFAKLEYSEAVLYLAPGLGIVQIETPDKTYVLKNN